MTAIETPSPCLIIEPATVDRAGMRALLERDADLEVIAHVKSVAEAMEITAEPSVVLVGLVSCDASEIGIVSTIQSRFPTAGILVLAHTADLETLRELVGDGIGYISKAADDAELARAARAVAHGGRYLDPSIGAVFAGGQPSTWRDTPLRDLSPAEIDVLRLLALGYTNAEIGGRLGYSVRSIETRRSQLQHKLDAHTRAELVRLALDAGLVDRPRPER